MTGLEYWPELNRKRFRSLPTVLQKGLLRRSLPAVVLLAETNHTDNDGLDVRRVLFDRLNTGGISLNPQELRNALSPGKFNKLLIELARSSPFTSAWGIPPKVEGEETNPPEELMRNPLFSSLADAELVLRFFALRDAIVAGKQGSLRLILDRYMTLQSSANDDDLAKLRDLFMDCLSRLLNVFGSSTFRLPGTRRLSRPLYDALMIALSLDPELPIEDNAVEVSAALEQALNDEPTYDILVGRGNTIGAVHERVELASRILQSGGE